MNAYRRDALVAGAAAAHTDAVRVPKKEARRMDVSVRTARRWTKTAPPQLRQMTLYLEGHPNPHRILAHLKTRAETDLTKMPTPALIDEYRRLLLEECSVEAEDRRGMLEGHGWLDLAAASERDAAVDIRKAAIERQFASRRVPRELVFHG